MLVARYKKDQTGMGGLDRLAARNNENGQLWHGNTSVCGHFRINKKTRKVKAFCKARYS